MISENENSLFGNPIYSYTRQKAIEDGVLIDLSINEIIRCYWKDPFACTDTVWKTIENAIGNKGCDLNGILSDISFIASETIRRSQTHSINSVVFSVEIGKTTWRLKLHGGPGDNPRQNVLTLMFSNED